MTRALAAVAGQHIQTSLSPLSTRAPSVKFNPRGRRFNAVVGVPGQTEATLDRAAAFGPFRLFPASQLLLEGEKPLRLGSRALEILIALVERPGVLITKEELVAR